jgi:hypothetical protein
LCSGTTLMQSQFVVRLTRIRLEAKRRKPARLAA